ncbi:metallophosphoesterase [Mycolicibacterium setense]|uniref:metallophosphoesterase n=1 Tax=Mycolicibacterium setense TaxID=431269 RepID=UPI0027E2DF48|nr:metallophosphoesterase [Mycolicibacterium setense]
MDGFDIFGGVHGCADKLKGLLTKLGYKCGDGLCWQSSRQAVFVGDLIDRGRQQLEVLRIVKPMVDNGSAQIVMGNHEFNAICIATPDPRDDAEFLRPHSEKNRDQHQAFLEQVTGETANAIPRLVQDLPVVARPRRHPRRTRLLARGFDESR